MPLSPNWDLPWPVLGDAADAPYDLQQLAEAADLALQTLHRSMQWGVATFTVPNGSNSAERQVTFPRPYAATPVGFAVVSPPSLGNNAIFYYAHVSRRTTTGMFVHATNRNSEIHGDTEVPVLWAAFGRLA